MLPPINFREWIDEHREFLRPPVCNRQVFPAGDFIIMVVGGPNSRTDYHDDPGQELFYQIEGDMLLKTMQDGRPVDVPIREGEMFLLPAHVPHSPQRFTHTVGLVIERVRHPGEKDGFIWFCDNCHAPLYSEYLHVSDIEKQLPAVFDRFYENEENRRCSECGQVMPPR